MHEQSKATRNTTPEPTPLALPGRPGGNPHWSLVEDGFNLAREHEVESLLTTANGYAGVRASLSQPCSLSRPATFLAGVFGLPDDEGPANVPELVKAPDWTPLSIEVDGHVLKMEGPGTLSHRRTLDLRQGILWRAWDYRCPDGRHSAVRALRLASLADRHVLLQSVLTRAENYSGRLRLETRITPLSPVAELVVTAEELHAPSLAGAVLFDFHAPGTGIRVALATTCRFQGAARADIRQQTAVDVASAVQTWEFEAELGATCRLDRLAVVYTSRDVSDPAAAAINRLRELAAAPFAEPIVEAHCRAWQEHWAASGVELKGDDDAQFALRFATYHLLATADPHDEHVSIGARALTGEAYKGHVFWDTEIFMLPFYTFTQPDTARALLMYRYHTLPGALEKARLLGYRGALYPWESTGDGRETTPPWGVLADGSLVRILSGELEQHISADVAYAVWQYWQATGDDAFFVEAGGEIVLQTARFWASRAQLGNDGRYHIRDVIGPDEYHEGVDNNAFTNLMAQWNLRRGIDTVALFQRRWPAAAAELLRRLALADEEVSAWQAVAEKMYTGFDPETGLFEQFEGFFKLESIDLSAYEPRTAPLDVLLGRERTFGAQVVKQADVVMLLALLWDELAPPVRAANFRYYEPRTGHGSSLSPATHALVAARLGDTATAMRYFRQGAEIDLANNMGNAAGGVHAAALGGLWQAAVLGFAGMRLRPRGLSFAPRLPESWRRFRVPLRCRGAALHVQIDQDNRRMDADVRGRAGLVLDVDGGPELEAAPGHRYRICWNDAGWEDWQELP